MSFQEGDILTIPETYIVTGNLFDRPFDPKDTQYVIDTFDGGCPNDPPSSEYTKLRVGQLLQEVLMGRGGRKVTIAIVVGDGGIGRLTLDGAISIANSKDGDRAKRTEDTQQPDYQEEILKKTV